MPGDRTILPGTVGTFKSQVLILIDTALSIFIDSWSEWLRKMDYNCRDFVRVRILLIKYVSG
jgi:hypothetical protein